MFTIQYHLSAFVYFCHCFMWHFLLSFSFFFSVPYSSEDEHNSARSASYFVHSCGVTSIFMHLYTHLLKRLPLSTTYFAIFTSTGSFIVRRNTGSRKPFEFTVSYGRFISIFTHSLSEPSTVHLHSVSKHSVQGWFRFNCWCWWNSRWHAICQ